jgi:hypothetical protein
MIRPKQRRFVEEYLLDLNPRKQRFEQGTSHTTLGRLALRTCQNLSPPTTRVAGAPQARGEPLQITQDDVLRGLHREATLAGDGASHAARVSAWTQIGKHLGMFVERRQQIGEDGLFHFGLRRTPVLYRP